MKRYLIVFVSALLSMGALAQVSRTEIDADPTLAGSNYLAYRGPQKALTPAPKGYKPFYLSHYGRHGSRYLIGTSDYDQPYNTLKKADRDGKLTAKGKEVLQKLALICAEAKGRDGELTQRGAEQHKGIAKRMYERFPEVFKGKTHVDAKSTVVIRCILSMENALQQLLVMNPQLVITHDASYDDMYYMNLDDKALNAKKMPTRANQAYWQFAARNDHHQRVIAELFNDTDYAEKNIDCSWLYQKLFKLASNVQSTELRHTLSLYDIFNKDEIYENWRVRNAWWYINYGPSPLNGGTQPYSQRNLLRKIISEADSCIALEHPGATLRYGHDTMVMPLSCLLGLNGLDKTITQLDDVDKQDWCDYKIFPMACNIQFVFYRKSATDKDPIFKVLLNEDEATLPIKTDMAPYYHWSDFKAYYLKKLADYKE